MKKEALAFLEQCELFGEKNLEGNPIILAHQSESDFVHPDNGSPVNRRQGRPAISYFYLSINVGRQVFSVSAVDNRNVARFMKKGEKKDDDKRI